MALKPSASMNAKLVNEPIQAPKIKVPTIAEHTEAFQGWMNKNAEWIKLLGELARDERGFSFTKPIEPDYTNDEAYKQKWNKYAAGLTSFIGMGASFLEAVAAAPFNLTMARELMIFSEGLEHFPHTAAVLWLEYVDGRHEALQLNLKARKKLQSVRGTKGQPPKLRDYEEVLKVLYFDELERWHPEWTNNPKPARRAALFTYLTGMVPDTKPAIDNEPKLQARRDASHLTLGKVHIRRKLAVPGGSESARALPGFWGLFSLSPFYAKDRGEYIADNSDLEWVKYATDTSENGKLKMHKTKLSHFYPATKFQVYEKVPRLFMDVKITKPGVYLHRSKAHGRDDFLVTVTGTTVNDRKCIVFCNKGVGGDADLIPRGTAGTVANFNDRFGESWDDPQNQKDRTLFAFNYAKKDADLTLGSWRNIGFCLQTGAEKLKTPDGNWHPMEVEIAADDFKHFATMYQESKRQDKLKDIATGFVEPYICVEISCLQRNRERMPTVTRGVDDGEIGYPVQVVTLSPNETSLRLYKTTEQQDYDYENFPLEIKEWLRVYSEQKLPESIQNEINTEVEAQRRFFTHLATQDQAALVEPAMTSLKLRMELAMKIARNLVASYLVFLNYGWATDAYTGSFSTRNFNSGPRDSNEWSPASLLGRDPGYATKPRAKVDFDNLSATFLVNSKSFLVYVLGLGATADPSFLEMKDSDMGDNLKGTGFNTSYFGVITNDSSIIKSYSVAAELFTKMAAEADQQLTAVKNDLGANSTSETLNAAYTKKLYARLKEMLNGLQMTHKDWLVELFNYQLLPPPAQQ